MVRRIISAVAGRKVAQSLGGGALGTAAATALPFIAARGLGPLGVALTGVWAYKKFKQRRDKHRTFPETATPAAPPQA